MEASTSPVGDERLDGVQPLQKTRGMRRPSVGRIRRRTPLCSFLVAGVVGLGFWAALPALAQGETSPGVPRIYRWIDENGIAHYTTELDRIPASLRSRASGLGRDEAVSPRAPSGRADRWITLDRAIAPDEEAWYEGGELQPAAPLDPALEAERQEEAAVALFDLDLRIAELEVDIARNEEWLKRMISDPDSGGPLASEHNTEFRSIAIQLPKQLSELRTLRDQREGFLEPGSDEASE